MKTRNKWLSGIFVILGSSIIFYSSIINSDKNIINFSIDGSVATINQTSGEMDITFPVGKNLSKESAIFTSSIGSNVTVYKLKQLSGISTQNFESSVPYIVTASDGTSKLYFTSIQHNSNKSHSYFNTYAINNGNGGLSYGNIVGTNINVEVPSNTNITSLTSYFNYIGRSVKVNSINQISNITTNNFTNPNLYTLAGQNGNPTTYTVNVTTSSPSSKEITRFSLLTGYGEFPCIINGFNISCGVPSDVVTSHLIANWSATGNKVEVASVLQTSGLTVNNFESPVIFTAYSGDNNTSQNYTITTSNNHLFLDNHNIAETIFSGFSYNVSFIATNKTESTLSNITDSINVPFPFTWTLGTNGCNNVSLNNTESCTISGTLTVESSNDDAFVTVKINDSNGNLLNEFNKRITAIPTLTSLESSVVNPQTYAAYRFTNAGSHRMFAAATVNGKSICFDNNNIGTVESSASSLWSTCGVEMTKNHDTLYIPAFPGVGGKILISMDTKIPDGTSPSVTATNPANTYYTRWQQVEYGGGLNASSNPALFNLNPTNVDFISIPVSISTVISGQVGPWYNNSFAKQGILFGDYVNTQTVFNAIKNNLSGIPNAPAKSWDGLPQNNLAGNSILRILSPSSVFPFMTDPANQFYFDGSAYTPYINDLWNYYTESDAAHPEYLNNFLYSNDDPIAALVNPGDTCTLKCQVTTVDSLMHCSQLIGSGTCPIGPNSGSLDGAYTGQAAGFTKFQAFDFISAAGTNAATTFGNNGTYRSLTGENIVSAQSVGFLPFCSNPNFVFGFNSFVANTPLFYQPQYSCLPNYASYGAAVLDQYSLQSSLYFFYYNYGYSDTLGQSGAVYSINNQLYPFTIDVNYQ